MDVALPNEVAKRIDESVERGDFASRDEFLKEAAELLLNVRRDDGSPIPVDETWESRVEDLVEEAEAGGEATEMTQRDWDEVERRGLALMRARKKA